MASHHNITSACPYLSNLHQNSGGLDRRYGHGRTISPLDSSAQPAASNFAFDAQRQIPLDQRAIQHGQQALGTQRNLHAANPLGSNDPTAPIPTVALARPPPSDLSDIPPLLTIAVTVLTPGIKNGIFSYRQNIKARVSLSRTVMGTQLPIESRSTSSLWLWCHAECQPCKSRDSSAHERCNPTTFYLNPVQDLNQNQGFAVTHTGNLLTFTGNITFEIKTRPRKPRAEDQTWRCPSESLILTYLLCDDAGRIVAEKRVDEPFQARVHSRRA